MKIRELFVSESQFPFQDVHPEYGGKDPNRTMTYDRLLSPGYAGEPWSDATDNWSGEEGPKLSPNTKQTITLKDRVTGKEADYDIDSPEAQEVIANQKQRISNSPMGKAVIKAFSTPVDRSKVKTVGQSDSTSDFSDSGVGDEIIPTRSAQTNVDIDDDKPMRFDIQKMRFVPIDEPAKSVLDPADALGPGEEIVEPSNTVTRSISQNVGVAPGANSKFVLWDPVKQRPVTQADQKRSANAKDSSSIPANPRSGSWQELAKLNNITDPSKLKAGTRINTPDGGSIYVNKGDTLDKLAKGIRDGNPQLNPKPETQRKSFSLALNRKKSI